MGFLRMQHDKCEYDIKGVGRLRPLNSLCGISSNATLEWHNGGLHENVHLSIPFVGFLRMQLNVNTLEDWYFVEALNSLCGISSNATYYLF